MKQRKITARIYAFTLATSLFVMDTLPALAATITEESTESEIQEMEEDFDDTAISSVKDTKAQTTAEKEKITASETEFDTNIPDETEDTPEAPGETTDETNITDASADELNAPDKAAIEANTPDASAGEPYIPDASAGESKTSDTSEGKPYLPDESTDGPSATDAPTDKSKISGKAAVEPHTPNETADKGEYTPAVSASEEPSLISDGQENDDGQIYIDGMPYNGYYMDNTNVFCLVSNGTAQPITGIINEGTTYYSYQDAALKTLPMQTVFVTGKHYTGYFEDNNSIFYIVSNGAAQPFTGTVNKRTEYYSCNDSTLKTLSSQAVFVEGKLYSGYYTDNNGKMYLITNGVQELKTGPLNPGTKYYSFKDKKTLTLSKLTVYVEGKIYSGYYTDNNGKMYLVTNGIQELKTGPLNPGTRYYSFKDKKTLTLSKLTVYVKGNLYSGYYADNNGKMYLAANGILEPKTGILNPGTKYYSFSAQKNLSLSKQTLYVNGNVYSGYYLSNKNKMYSVHKGSLTLKTGTISAGTKYYSHNAKKVLSLSKQTLYVNGNVYSGYYLNNKNNMYSVKKGILTLKTGIIKAGTKYYSYNAKKTLKISKQTLYVNGKIYSGYYLNNNNKMYSVHKGILTLKTGTVKAGTKYYSYNAKKMRKISKQTLYVKGNVYSGYYLSNKNKLYSVKKGILTLKTGTVKAGTKYYSYNAKKTRKISKQTLYVKGNVYSGYYLSNKNKLYSVKKGILTLKTGTVKAGTKYYSYNAKKTRKISKQTLYVKGKIYSGYYLSNKNKMYYVNKGTLTLKTGVIKAGTKYYSYNAKKTRKISKQTLYVNGKIYSGYYLDNQNAMYSVNNGTLTLETGFLSAGTAYYCHNTKKTQMLGKPTLYVNGSVYSGYYLDGENMMYSVTDGTCTLTNTTLYAGTFYFSYNAGQALMLTEMTVYVNGEAMEGMSPESLATLQRAQAVVSSITNDSMSQEEKLRICFDFVKTYEESRPRMPHYKGMDWPVVYANDMFINGTGNCCSYAAAFAYMAKAIGYEEVYCCNSGGHGWAEINGLVYDPEWSKWHHVYNYYGLSYGTPTDQNYIGAIGAGYPWMRIKI